MKDNVVILDGRINPDYPETITEVMKDYPGYEPIWILLGEIHAIKYHK